MPPRYVLPLPAAWLDTLPAEIRWASVAFQRKTELHLTVCGRALRAQIATLATRDAVLRRLDRFAADVRPSLAAARTGRCVHLRDGLEQSVAELLELPMMADLYSDLDALGVVVGDPVPHVTLYVHQSPGGIGVAHRQDLARLQVGPTLSLADLTDAGPL